MVTYKAKLGPLTWLTDQLSRIVSAAAAVVTSTRDKVRDFREVMRENVTDFTLAAAMAGSGDTELSAELLSRVRDQVETQLVALEGFTDAIASGGLSEDEIAARAQMYVGAPVAVYSQASVGELELPAHPADGSSECLSNDRCHWEIEEDDDEWRAYWRLEEGSKHCETCLTRSREWNPLRIPKG